MSSFRDRAAAAAYVLAMLADCASLARRRGHGDFARELDAVVRAAREQQPEIEGRSEPHRRAQGARLEELEAAIGLHDITQFCAVLAALARQAQWEDLAARIDEIAQSLDLGGAGAP